ncbi:hypothetical protein NMY22_g16413 [Coprinellus aureogranulatus]|nr:hypothetical protein NMY22_g16413 [Coprinellus aureogranulatus]
MSRYQHQGPPRQGPPHHGPPHQQHGPGPTTAPVLTNCFEISRVPTKTFVMYDGASALPPSLGLSLTIYR